MGTSCIVERRAQYAGFETRELAVAGSGPTIVLVHGFGHASQAWRQVLDLLHDAGQAAVAVDLPGFGGADPLSAGELVPQLDTFLAEVIRRYGGAEGAVVVGNSLGAAMAARMGRDSALPILAVMALDIAGITWKPLVSAGLPVAIAASGPLTKIPYPHRARAAVAERLLERSLARLLYGRKSAVDPAVVADLASSAPDTVEARRLMRLGARFKTELDRAGDHGGVRVPMVVVHGANDRLVPVSSSRILHEANPGSRLVVLPRIGHCPQLDAPTVISRLALELAGIPNDKRATS